MAELFPVKLHMLLARPILHTFTLWGFFCRRNFSAENIGIERVARGGESLFRVDSLKPLCLSLKWWKKKQQFLW